MRSAMKGQNLLQPEQPVKRKPGRPRLSEEEKKRRRLEKKNATAPPTKATSVTYPSYEANLPSDKANLPANKAILPSAKVQTLPAKAKTPEQYGKSVLHLPDAKGPSTVRAVTQVDTDIAPEDAFFTKLFSVEERREKMDSNVSKKRPPSPEGQAELETALAHLDEVINGTRDL